MTNVKLSEKANQVIDLMRDDDYACMYDTQNDWWIVSGQVVDKETMTELMMNNLIHHETGEGHVRYWALTDLGKSLPLQ
jgi:hypothetical protein